MTYPPCLRFCLAYPGNPRNRIEGKSPHSRKDIRSALNAGYSLARTVMDDILRILHLIASGLVGEPTAPVIGIAGATNMNS